MNASSTDRVIHVPLSEADWKAFLASQPQPVTWLRERIQKAIETARRQTAGSEQQFNGSRYACARFAMGKPGGGSRTAPTSRATAAVTAAASTTSSTTPARSASSS